MFKMKGTKRSLLMSVLALLLCVSMLIGSTFAWFTDSVTSAGNIIKSGKLEVTMEWKDATATGAQQTYKNAAAGPIFNYDNWEPGYVEAKNVKIANVGTLALKYQLNILPTGDVSELADVIDVYFAEGEITLANREMTELKRVGTLSDVLAGMPANMRGDLEAEKNDTVTIALKMREDAGNEYQGLSIGTSFSVQLLATQLTAEEDSFGPDYDEDATLGTYIELDAGADLMAAMASAKADMPLTIKLNGNIELPTAGSAGGVADITRASSVVIDGNGNTITVIGSGVTPIGDKEAPVTLKNVKIIDNSKSYNESAWELSYCELGGVINCVNVDFADAVMVEGTSASFVDCSFVGHNDKITGTTQYAVWVSNGDAIFTNCTFSGTRGLKICDQYTPEVGMVVVDGCTFANISEKPGVAIDDEDTQDMKITIKNCNFINCQPGDQGLYIYESDNTLPTLENNKVFGVAATNEELKASLTNGANVALGKGVYTLPTLSGKENITLIGTEDTVIGGEYASTGFGGNFGKSTTIKNVTFSGTTNGVRSSYAQGGTTVFENCTFAGDSIYGFHIDESNGATFIFKNCTFSGFNAFAGDLEKVVFEGCTFKHNGNYGHTNIWSRGEFTGCTFEAGTSVGPRDGATIIIDGVSISGVQNF